MTPIQINLKNMTHIIVMPQHITKHLTICNHNQTCMVNVYNARYFQGLPPATPKN